MHPTGPWIVRPRPRPAAARRLFCFPYAGVGASAYRGWAEAVGDDVEVCCVQPPGKEARWRERPIDSLAAFADAVVPALREFIDRPYVLFGHSLGGTIAFECARRLDPGPEHLFVSASRAPHLGYGHPTIRHLPDRELLDELHRRYESVPSQVLEDRELLDLLMPALRADVTMLETYEYIPGPPLGCGVTCFGGIDDRMVTRAALDGWREHTRLAFRLNMLAGNHLLLQSARPQLLEVVNRTLAAEAVNS